MLQQPCSVTYHCDGITDLLFDELDVLSTILRKLFVVLDSSDIAFPSRKCLINGLSLVEEVSNREFCCNFSVDIIAYAYRNLIEVAEYVKYCESYICCSLKSATVFGEYTFSWDKERLCAEEYIALGNAQIQAIDTGYFDAVAHPDRIFRKRKDWSEGMATMADHIIDSARRRNIPLEINESSKLQNNHYREEFWDRAYEVQIIHGVDAHSIDEVRML